MTQTLFPAVHTQKPTTSWPLAAKMFIFDDGDDRSPFDPTLMKRYAPSYDSLDQYWADIESKPLRRAVMGVIAPRHLDRTFIRFRAGIGKKHFIRKSLRREPL